eukprot:8985092-Pyramimonas_sp.AAC.1
MLLVQPVGSGPGQLCLVLAEALLPLVGEALALAPARVRPREDELVHLLHVLLGRLVGLGGTQVLGHPPACLVVVAIVADLLQVELLVLLEGQLVA